MAIAYYSTVFDHPALDVWEVIRDFNNYSVWLPNTSSRIEEGRSGDSVGAVRNVQIGERTIRQRLLAHSDVDRAMTYEFCGPPPFPVRDFRATLQITPIVDGDRAFVAWWATFDCAAAEIERWTHYFAHEGFAVWLASLRGHLARARAA
jgi:hypothetical protein